MRDIGNSAAVAQDVRRELLTWPDVAEVHGPQLGDTDVYYLRFVGTDGSAYSIELRKERH